MEKEAIYIKIDPWYKEKLSQAGQGNLTAGLKRAVQALDFCQTQKLSDDVEKHHLKRKKKRTRKK